jgi:hypothetical protein
MLYEDDRMSQLIGFFPNLLGTKKVISRKQFSSVDRKKTLAPVKKNIQAG